MRHKQNATSEDLAELRRLALHVMDRVSELSDRVSVLENQFSAAQKEDSPPAQPHGR